MISLPFYLPVVMALLLPVAAFSGWYFARRHNERFSGARVNELSSHYFRGLNYLLNEQPDKAIEVFLELAEHNRDTVETHLALGNLFRRRGEVDRAIRVHQHLISRTNLSNEEKTAALLELGEDYMRAGLLDRAETLFTDLVLLGAHAPLALKHLIAIYQHEKDWEKAIAHAQQLEEATGDSQATVIAQFYCEMAEQWRASGEMAHSYELTNQALKTKPDCVRAHIIQAYLALGEGKIQNAMQSFETVVQQDMDFVRDILPLLLDCYARAEQKQRAENFLSAIVEHYKGISPVLALTKVYTETRGESFAINFLTQQLRARPSVRGLMALIDVSLDKTTGEIREKFLILRDLTRKLLEDQSLYRCKKCGFGAKSHYWQCPGCKTWDSVRPIHGVVGE